MNGQVETGSSIKIDRESDLKASKFDLSTGLETPKSDSKITLYSLPKELSEYGRPKRPFNMNGDDGFFKPNTEITPKWFKKDKAIKDEFKSDQYLGDFKSSGKFVHLVYRDHEHVDGDQVRIFINDDVIRSKIYLSSAFQGIKINLTKGFNKIDIQALNQGESGPNTAEFQLYDDQGVLITGNEWNLTTGVKATMIVVKE
ncbi:hypothetical protein D1816_04870 [Aquimarina sp. AD10]|uniref:Uncharacterized protein n=1 Tax=Aquimarina aggregata TaxID=1642818 RepID=A0A163CDG0_9FLAO|nr:MULTISPECIES: hypothetical protein [Aquimarina]AXT59715.1 hypothetical protein D1816_04870 [Aquimarina sp. AD10]KZS42295.1 hypothetical protein AWE51_02315 [Aquimarina aggregata]RKM97591.1 hypothetical protein D7033_14450 [Aquimarina sp. AD10]